MMIAGMAVRTSPALPPQTATALAVVPLLYCGLGAWGIMSAIGLLLLRNWARLSFLIFGGILAAFSLSAAAGSLLAVFVAPTTALSANVPQQVFKVAFVVAAVISVTGLGIAAWWLVLFNRAAVKSTFVGEAVATARPSRLPLAVSIIAWLLIFGGAITAVGMFAPNPALLFGLVLRGWAASLVFAVFAAASLTAGTGMLKRQVDAHTLALGLVGLGILNMLSLMLPGSAERVQALMVETQGSVPFPVESLREILAFAMLFGIAMLVTMFLLLLRARKPFIEACRLHVE